MPTIPAPATADGDAAAALAALSAAALDAADETDLVATLVPVAYELLGVDQLHLVELSGDGACGHASVLLTDGRPPQGYTVELDDGPTGTGRVAATGDVLHVPDAAGSSLLRAEFTARFDVASALFVPLAWDGAVRWVAVLIRQTLRPFTDAETELAGVLCNLHAAGLALLEARDAARASRALGGAPADGRSRRRAGGGADRGAP